MPAIENGERNPVGELRLHGNYSAGGDAAGDAAVRSPALPDSHSYAQGPLDNRKIWQLKESNLKGSAEEGDAVMHAERAAGFSNETACDIPFAEWRQVGSKERGEPERRLSTEKEKERENAMGTESGQTACKDLILKETSREDIVESQISNTVGFTSHTPPTTPKHTTLSPHITLPRPPTPWKVFSRTRRGRKLHTECCQHSKAQNSGPQLQQPNTQQQQQISSPREQRQLDQEEEGDQGQLNNDHRGDSLEQHTVEETGSAENKQQEAKELWELAKQLGVSGMNNQEEMVEKFMNMEVRDSKVAEKGGNQSYIS